MAPPTTVVLDIETIPDRALFTPPEPAPGAPPPFPPLYACRPVVIGVMWLDESLALRRVGLIGEGKDERGMLADFADFMDAHRPRLVTWNGRGFDLPVLLLRSLAQGLSWPWYYAEPDYRDRRSDAGHIDVADFLAEHGAARMTSLDGAARLIGLPGKNGMDGGQVESLYLSGDFEGLRRYCLSDVAQTAFLYLRFRLFTGALDRAAYQQAAGALYTALAADPRMAWLGTADRQRLIDLT
jgi:3'-5' exonuclease